MEIIDNFTAYTEQVRELNHRLDNHITQETQREDALDAAERSFRAKCNNLVDARLNQKAAVEAAQQRISRRESARLFRRILRDANLEKFWRRTFGSVAVVASLAIFFATDNMSAWLAMSGISLASAYFVHNFLAFTNRNTKNPAHFR